MRALLFLLPFFVGCGEDLVRPSRVSTDSVYSPGVKRGYWQSCRIDKENGSLWCTICRRDGHVIFDEIFEAYDPDLPVLEEDLVVVPYGSSNTIVLSNGRLLFPKSEYSRARQYWQQAQSPDWVDGRHPRIVPPKRP